MARWEELPDDMLNATGKCLESYVDYVRVGAVCKSWNSALLKMPTHRFKQIPWLMLPFDDETQTSRSFYSILDDKVYHLELSETRGKFFRGSCYGWLVMLEMSPRLSLFNPLTKLQIDLPPLYTFPDMKSYCPDNTDKEYNLIDYLDQRIQYWSQARMQEVYIEKLVLSSPPDDDYLAIAIFGEFRRLAFCSRNDNKWIAIETGSLYCFADVIFYEDKIYALIIDGQLLVSDVSSLPNFTFIAVEVPEILPKLFLVGSSNGLMMVGRDYIFDDHEHDPELVRYETTGFKIYLLESNSGEEMPKWSEITDLGDNVMFLGYNSSVLIPTVGVPKLKRNCIYYTDDQMELWEESYGGFDFGFFDLDEGRIEKFVELNPGSQHVWPPPLWVVPNP